MRFTRFGLVRRSRSATWSRRPAPAAFVCALLALAHSFPATAAERCLQVDNVEDWDFLNIREKPDHLSGIVAAIAPRTGAYLYVTGPCVPRGEPKLTRRWCPVEFQPLPGELRSGYVKSFFSKEVPCPAFRPPRPVEPAPEPAEATTPAEPSAPPPVEPPAQAPAEPATPDASGPANEDGEGTPGPAGAAPAAKAPTAVTDQSASRP